MSNAAIVYLCVNLCGMGYLIAKHGQTERINAVSSFGAWAVILAILYWGGFFS